MRHRDDLDPEDIPKDILAPHKDDLDPEDVPPIRPDLTGGRDPYAEVEQTGRFTWSIRICHGILVWGPEGCPFTYWGTEAGAARKAEKLLERYERILEKREDRRNSRFEVY